MLRGEARLLTHGSTPRASAAARWAPAPGSLGGESLALRYPTPAGPAEPIGLFGRLAREGIRLRRSGLFLVAEVPGSASRARWCPAMDRLLERHAASLAVTIALARRFADDHPPERVSALLAELHHDVPRVVLETVGGAERLAGLIASPPRGAELDLACVACCRGLAIRAIREGRELAGLFADEESDDEEGGRRHRATADPGRSGQAERRIERRGDLRP